MRETLLETAIDHFGRLGFEGAGTRAIAEASGTAMSSITYHFGGKQGLYLAAAEHIAGAIREMQQPALEAVTAGEPADAEDARRRFLGLLDDFAVMMLSPRTESWSRFIIREQEAPTQAFERIFGTAMQPQVEAFVRLGSVARPDLADREVRAMCVLLMGEALVLRACRASVCRVIGAERIDEGAAALLRSMLAANARCILTAPSPKENAR